MTHQIEDEMNNKGERQPLLEIEIVKLMRDEEKRQKVMEKQQKSLVTLVTIKTTHFVLFQSNALYSVLQALHIHSH